MERQVGQVGETEPKRFAMAYRCGFMKNQDEYC